MLDELALLCITAAIVIASLWAACHALLHKRDPRSALVWVSLSLSVPVIGALAYWLLGINRITRRAHRWHKSRRKIDFHTLLPPDAGQPAQLPESFQELQTLETLAAQVVKNSLRTGNLITPLKNGEEAYPAMLAAIDQASHSIHLCSYIFDGDRIGARFCSSLAAAVKRGVIVRVIVDALGEHYSSLTARVALAGSGVDIRHYLPLYKAPFINLRNHRKLLVIDGRCAFTGGMNIRSNHCVASAAASHAASDLHFQVAGPVVQDLQRIFLEDWHFITGQLLDDVRYFPPLQSYGNAFVRAIADGPDREFRKLEWMVTGALSTAKQRVRIMPPYFIPDRSMVTALITAALRGVKITLVLPQLNNLPFVAWASRASYWELIKNGIQIFEQPPPFAHTKLLLVDDLWSLIGSANLDTRSFRLNFELNLAVYDVSLTAELNRHIESILAVSRLIPLHEMDARPLAIKLRDSAARLFSPYL